MLDFLSEEPSVSVEQNLIIVEFEQAASMGHCEEGDVQFLGLVVELRLDVHADSAGAFVQNGEERPVVEEPRHCHALFFSARKDVCPIVDRIETALAIFDVVETDIPQQLS